MGRWRLRLRHADPLRAVSTYLLDQSVHRQPAPESSHGPCLPRLKFLWPSPDPDHPKIFVRIWPRASPRLVFFIHRRCAEPRTAIAFAAHEPVTPGAFSGWVWLECTQPLDGAACTHFACPWVDLLRKAIQSKHAVGFMPLGALRGPLQGCVRRWPLEVGSTNGFR